MSGLEVRIIHGIGKIANGQGKLFGVAAVQHNQQIRREVVRGTGSGELPGPAEIWGGREKT